jgi:hypothetical protein
MSFHMHLTSDTVDNFHWLVGMHSPMTVGPWISVTSLRSHLIMSGQRYRMAVEGVLITGCEVLKNTWAAMGLDCYQLWAGQGSWEYGCSWMERRLDPSKAWTDIIYNYSIGIVPLYCPLIYEGSGLTYDPTNGLTKRREIFGDGDLD